MLLDRKDNKEKMRLSKSRVGKLFSVKGQKVKIF